MGSVDLEMRVEHLEQALLKVCVAAMDLVAIAGADRQPQGALSRIHFSKPVDVQQALLDVVHKVSQAVEIVSGEDAPR